MPFYDDPHHVQPTLLYDPEPRPVDDDRLCANCRHPRWMHDRVCAHATWPEKHHSRKGEKRCSCRGFVKEPA